MAARARGTNVRPRRPVNGGANFRAALRFTGGRPPPVPLSLFSPRAWTLLAFLGAAPVAASQAPPDSLREPSAAASAPFLRIDGSVSARTLVHRTAPAIEVRFSGDLVDTLSADRRENLPRPVEPGVTYRDVRVYFEVRSALPDAEAFLNEALRPRPAEGDEVQAPPPEDAP